MSQEDLNLLALELQRPYLVCYEGRTCIDMLEFANKSPDRFRRWIDICRVLRMRKRMVA